MNKLVVTVTDEDIERGRKTASGCPLARAIRRATTIRPVAVFGRSAGWDCGYKAYPLSPAAVAFVAAFDNGWPVAPEQFVIEGPA